MPILSEDAERFFDVIVGACNEELIREILVDRPRDEA